MKIRCIFTLFLIFSISGCFIYEKPDLPDEIQATEIIAAYKENEFAAEQKYKGRKLVISGEIANLSQIEGKIGVIIENYDPKSSLAIVCVFNANQNETTSNLRRGQNVRLLGESKGKISEYTFYMSDCKIR